jgi:hypothetical protein
LLVRGTYFTQQHYTEDHKGKRQQQAERGPPAAPPELASIRSFAHVPSPSFPPVQKLYTIRVAAASPNETCARF